MKNVFGYVLQSGLEKCNKWCMIDNGSQEKNIFWNSAMTFWGHSMNWIFISVLEMMNQEMLEKRI